MMVHGRAAASIHSDTSGSPVRREDQRYQDGAKGGPPAGAAGVVGNLNYLMSQGWIEEEQLPHAAKRGFPTLLHFHQREK
jgi:hypothetical protein